MKKTKRSLLCLMLAVLMVMSCAITAMAAENESTALIGGTLYEYSWRLTRSDTCGTGRMDADNPPAYLTVKVRNYLCSEENDTEGHNAWVSNTGYSGVTTIASNVLVINGVNVPSEVIHTDGKFYIGGTEVLAKNNVA